MVSASERIIAGGWYRYGRAAAPAVPAPELRYRRQARRAVVEQRDLVAGIAARASGKQIGGAFKNAQGCAVLPAETASLSSSISDLLGAGLGLSGGLSSGGTILKAAA
ncbi:MAG: hypothetical protein WBD90_14220 [Xanthobacteraceae bacterium]